MSVNIRSALLAAAAVVLSIPSASAAYDFVADGIYYSITSTFPLFTVSVTYETKSYNSYSGSIVIPSTVTYSGKTYSVTGIESRAFYNCSSLTSIIIPSSVTRIGIRTFYGSSSLTSINIPDGVTHIYESTFYGCSSLTSINIPDGVTSIESSVFEGCSSLTSVTIPDSVTNIGDSAFSSCSSLTSITIPDGVTNIHSSAFSSCSSLTSITIPGGVTIWDSAFEGCSSLTSITIPGGVTIWDSAFEGCNSLADVYCMSTTPPSCSSFEVFPTSTYSDAKLHVPSGCVSVYSSDDVWGLFFSIVDDAESGIHSVEADAIEPAITARDGMIEVSGIDGGTVNVYSTSGALVATGEAGGSAINVPGDGIYIVRINAEDYEIVRKVAVK